LDYSWNSGRIDDRRNGRLELVGIQPGFPKGVFHWQIGQNGSLKRYLIIGKLRSKGVMEGLDLKKWEGFSRMGK